MSDAFADHFSGVAAGYASYRPHYPDALFAYLASVTPARSAAWDCAAGNGQATLALAAHFERVVATDASEAQLKLAPAHPRVEYHVVPAEASGLPAGSADLITVAQAVHWFDFDRFYTELRRVAAPRGIIAVWSYGRSHFDDAAIDETLEHFYTKVVGPYWPPERRYIEEEYRTIPFPFEEITAPGFVMTARWTLARLLGYLRTWSATWRYREVHGHDPVIALESKLAPLWGAADAARDVRWPLALRVGRVT